MQAAYVSLRLCLAFIFIYASFDKIINPKDFADIVYSYKILPVLFVNPVAIFLPWFELVLGVLLLVGKYRDASVFLVNVLLLSFWLLMIANYYRGVDVSCGCFSTKPDASASMLWYMFRDGIFVLMGICLAWVHWKRSPKI